MYCKNCGKEINDSAAVCPYCGVVVNQSALSPAVQKTNTLAIVGFILSFFIAIAGLVCSIIARKQCYERGEGGASLALAGIIISIVSIAIVFLYIIIVLALAGTILSAI